jgi:biopolymer transport protein ExbB
MTPLAVLAFIIYFCIIGLYLELFVRRFERIDENLWRHWVDKPEEAKGELGDIIRFASANNSSISRLRACFTEVRSDYIPRINSRIRFSMIICGTAPLAGLLGTVTGMLTTFDGLASGAGSSTASLVAGGIAEALITTMTGLVIAIPGLVLISRVKVMRDSLELFLLRLENAFVRKVVPRRAAS